MGGIALTAQQFKVLIIERTNSTAAARFCTTLEYRAKTILADV